jgi:hypothetical protein
MCPFRSSAPRARLSLETLQRQLRRFRFRRTVCCSLVTHLESRGAGHHVIIRTHILYKTATFVYFFL